MKIRLVLFFTRGVSLRTWNMVGNLDREIAVYRRLQEQGFEVSFVTYGGREDLELVDSLHGIRLLCNEEGLPFQEYEETLIHMHARWLQSCHVIKTNQTNGAEMALHAAQLFNKPLVARCGYLWSHNAAREFGHDSAQAREARRVEDVVFKAADLVLVTTEIMRSDVIRRIPAAGDKTVVVPNYVDTEAFKPQLCSKELNSIIFVGRIAPEKNLESLLKAVQTLAVKVVVIGEGRLRPELQAGYDSLDGKIRWEGNVANSDLPRYMNSCGIFVLPSFYEGHPKALAEAMACELPVIGADSVGIRDMIKHGETGYICATDPEGIREAIRELIADPDLCTRLGRNARTYIQENYALHKIVSLEATLLREVART